MRRTMNKGLGLAGTALSDGVRALQAMAKITEDLLRAIWNLVRAILGIFGVRVPPMPPRKDDFVGEGDIVRETHDAEETVEAVSRMKRSIGLGGLVHEYASAHHKNRASINLDQLDADQQIWLYTLSTEHLNRLAELGPRACDKAIRGERCGIVDLPTVQGFRLAREEATAAADREREIDGMRPIQARIHRHLREREGGRPLAA